MKVRKLTTLQDFESLKEGDELIVVWMVRESWNNDMKGKMIYRVLENRKGDNEIILRIKGNHYFNYKLLLKGESVAEEVHLIEEDSQNSDKEKGVNK